MFCWLGVVGVDALGIRLSFDFALRDEGESALQFRVICLRLSMKAAREVIAKSTPSLTANDIQRLISGRETANLECKEAKGGLPDSLWESYSAFANTDGGVILLGVREMDGRLTVSVVANAKKLIKEEIWLCRSEDHGIV